MSTEQNVKEVNSVFDRADTELNKAVFSLMSEGRTFWALLALGMNRMPIPDSKCITTEIKDKSIELQYDPELVVNTDKTELQGYILHECIHLLYRHAFRFMESKEVIDLGTPSSKQKTVDLKDAKFPIKASDVAADVLVHYVLNEMDTKYTKHCLSKNDVNLHFDSWDWANKVTSEDIEQQVLIQYALVNMPQGKGNSSGQGQDQDQGQGQGQGQSQEGNGNGEPKEFKGKSINQHKSPTYKNDFERRLGQKAVERAVLNARDQAKGQGHMPACIEQELELMQAPAKIDWRAVLANYVAAAIPAISNKTWSRLNRHLPYLIKGRKKVPAPLIGVAMDTSGSVSDEQIKAFINEIDYIRKLHKADLTIVECDCVINKVVKLKHTDKLPSKIAGRGGTEYIPALKYFDDEKKKPDVVVFFTDLEVSDSDIPDEPRNYKIIWVGTDRDRCEYFQDKGKYGKFIPLDLDE